MKNEDLLTARDKRHLQNQVVIRHRTVETPAVNCLIGCGFMKFTSSGMPVFTLQCGDPDCGWTGPREDCVLVCDALVCPRCKRLMWMA